MLGFSRRMCCAGRQPGSQSRTSVNQALGRDKAWLSSGRRGPLGSRLWWLWQSLRARGLSPSDGDTRRRGSPSLQVLAPQLPGLGTQHPCPLPPPLPHIRELGFQPAPHPSQRQQPRGGQRAPLTWAARGNAQSREGPGKSWARRKALPPRAVPGGPVCEQRPPPPGQGDSGFRRPGGAGAGRGRPPPRRPIQRAAGEPVRGKNPGLLPVPPDGAAPPAGCAVCFLCVPAPFSLL